MSYTNAWSDTIPLGSEAAGHIDDFMRQMRLDVHERMDSLVVDWTADPVVIQPSLIASSGDTFRYIDGIMFKNTSGAREDYSISPILPSNAVITRIIGWFVRGSGTVTMELKERSFTLGGYTDSDVDVDTSLSSSTGGEQFLDTGVVSHALASTKLYFIRFDTGGGGSYALLGAKVLFELA